jgi:histidine triad (HIT) family protein
MKIWLTFWLLLISGISGLSQEADYDTIKKQKLSQKSPFEKIVDRELPATIEYEDDDIIAFLPLRLKAPVHYPHCSQKAYSHRK